MRKEGEGGKRRHPTNHSSVMKRRKLIIMPHSNVCMALDCHSCVRVRARVKERVHVTARERCVCACVRECM